MRKPHIERMASGAYSARISDPMRPGIRIRITDDTEAKVLARVERALELTREVKRGEADPKDLRRRFAKLAMGAPTVREVWDAHAATLRGQWKRKVGGIWRVQIAPMLGELRIFELTPEKMAAWEELQRRAGRGLKTIGNAFIALRAAVRASERVDEVPWRKWRPQGVPKGYESREACRSLVELEALILACADYDRRSVAATGALGDLAVRVLVLALTGLRQGEGVALGWDALGLDAPEPENWTMTVRFSAHEDWATRGGGKGRPMDPPKGNKLRTQTLHEHAALALRHQRERLRALGLYREDGPVFPTRQGAWRHGSQLIDPEVLRRCVVAANLPTEIGKTWTVHSLRHTFATLETYSAWSLTGDVAAAMARTGHAKVEVLMGYLRRAGRGRPAPFIPALGGDASGFLSGALPKALPASEMAPVAQLAHRRLGELAAVAGGDAAAPAPGEARALKVAAPRSLAELARAHPEGRPAEVSKMAEARYRRAYAVAQRAGESPEACRQRGGASRRAFLGAWARAQARALAGKSSEAGT